MARLRRADWRGVAIIAGAVVVGLAISWVLWAQQTQRQQIAGLSTALAAQRQQAQQSGQTPVAQPPDRVREHPERPTVKPEPGPSGPQGPGPTDAQVRAAVDAYFAEHPVADGRAPTPAEIAAAVINYLKEHPPKQGERGPGPTPEQVASAVAEYLASNPPPSGPPGPQGERGERGPGPTGEQIAAAVRDYLAANPLPTCPDGYEARAEQVLTATGPKDAVICEMASQ